VVSVIEKVKTQKGMKLEHAVVDEHLDKRLGSIEENA
jgi:hypothetical protein